MYGGCHFHYTAYQSHWLLQMNKMRELTQTVEQFFVKGENLSQEGACLLVVMMQLNCRLFRLSCVEQDSGQMKQEGEGTTEKSKWHQDDLD
jgi:hypothetical protein